MAAALLQDLYDNKDVNYNVEKMLFLRLDTAMR